jgi:sulfite reductase (NADPH) hemoprotein beta-component
VYTYTPTDQQIVDDRVAQFRDQTARFLAGELSEEQFRPLRLQNGLYVQRHAPMLRVAIPYGMVSSKQLRMFAHLARTYDRGYGHFSTRQNIQFNWPALERVPDMLADLATVEMHAIQTSGNCIRNTTTDHFAGIAPDEALDPRPYTELIRQWSTFHPEFAYLPRKFKIAVNAAAQDRAATWVHDIGVLLSRNSQGEVVASIIAGGGLGRAPVIGHIIKEGLPRRDLLTYLDAALRVYNLHGRRDNKYKARIKILVKDLSPAEFARQVEAEWAHSKGGAGTVPEAEFVRLEAAFTAPPYKTLQAEGTQREGAQQKAARHDLPKHYERWLARNTHAHKVPGYRAVTLSLKRAGSPPGDITADELDEAAQLADAYSFGEARVTHEQNLVLADVEESALRALYAKAKALGFATPNIGLLTNMIACPGGDFCALANAKSLPVEAAIRAKFEDLDYLFDIGELDLNISGCINSCGHHHVGHIGILGVDKDGQEFYQITIGGNQGGKERSDAALGKVLGPSLAQEEVADAVETLVTTYLDLRFEGERFIDTVQRTGAEPFKFALYPPLKKAA